MGITSTVTSETVSTVSEGRSQSQTPNLRRSGLRNIGTRESPRLNSNREVTKAGPLGSASTTGPALIIRGDPIIISDDDSDSDDSDIQVIHI